MTKKNLILFNLIFCYLLTFGILPALAKQVYYPQVGVGKHQGIGTLSPILPKSGKDATEAVILLPGLNSVKLKNDMYEWHNFWESWKKYPLEKEFKDNYRLYVFRYDGWDSLYSSSDKLAQGIHELLEKEPQTKSISFIGYSQGGILPRILFVKNPEIEKATRKVITMAAPHQGAIVLTEKLVRDCIKLQPAFVQAKNNQLLDLFVKWYAFAYYEQAWSNFDDGFPVSANYKPPKEALGLLAPQDKSKFITYASYFYPPVAIDLEDKFGKVFGETIPRLLLDRRSGMKELNRWTRKKVYPDEKPALRDHLKLNDGITPLVSGLWGRMCEPGEVQPEAWRKLFPTNNFCPNTPTQRVFFGVDHLRWREPVSGTMKIVDQMHPEAPSKAIYEWIIWDLIN